MLVNNTPLETYHIGGIPILVKREDLSCPYPGPSFSKMRGVVAHIKNRPESVIGVLDTAHSKAGWAVAYACSELGKSSLDFWPHYKNQEGLKPQQQEARRLGAELIELQAGRSCILYHRAKKLLPEGAYMMPNALKLPESITENALEAERTIPLLPETGTVVISISSGTVAAGIIKGLQKTNLDFLLHLGYSRSIIACQQYIVEKSGVQDNGRFTFVDEGYGYADASSVVVPFPCNKFYDAKAWAYLLKNADKIKKPIIMWSIGD